MKVKTLQQAWDEADKLIAGDYEIDEQSSKTAGYPIWRSNTEYYDYIYELGDRLEVNTKDGKSVNIWIEEKREENKAMTEKIQNVIEELENRIKWEQETIDRYTEEIRESTAKYSAKDLVTFIPGKLRNLEEAMNRQRESAQQIEILKFVSKEN